MKEAVVLGPPEQEFIIVTGDGDFVPLIYRLVALRHRVQIWAAPIREPYRVLEMYLGVNVIDLSEVLSELETAQPDVTATPTPNRNQKRRFPLRRRSFGQV